MQRCTLTNKRSKHPSSSSLTAAETLISFNSVMKDNRHKFAIFRYKVVSQLPQLKHPLTPRTFNP